MQEYFSRYRPYYNVFPKHEDQKMSLVDVLAGSISHGRPARRTNRILVSAARFSGSHEADLPQVGIGWGADPDR